MQTLVHNVESQSGVNAIVSRLSTCKEIALSDITLSALEPVRQNGALAEIYLQFANSEPAIRAYLGMEAALQEGSLDEQELECIKLLVSELTQCEYCLSIHSFKATKAGIGQGEQLLIRQGKPTGNSRFDIIVRLVLSLFKQPGVLEQSVLDDARSAGFSDENLVDICMGISTIFFTNIVNHINHSSSTLPAAPDIN